jgi:DNA-binding transcriptional LysR family regulator
MATLRLIATPIYAGYSERQVARGLGISQSSVSKRLDELRDELSRLTRE